MIRFTKTIRREGFKNFVRYLSDDGCSPCKPTCPCPPPPTTDRCPKPQPCPPPPPLPQGRCQENRSYDPCNYCPPACPDPDYPDLTKLKRLQCHYQKEDGNFIWMKGPYDKLLFQIACVSVAITVLNTVYSVITYIKMS